MKKSMMVLIAGPYRSGTQDRPELIAKNLQKLEGFAFQIYERGHVPVIGEWLALPLMVQGGSKTLGDEVYQQYSYPVADRLLEHCDAVLRIPGESIGADGDVKVAKALGLPVFHAVDELPDRSQQTKQGLR